MVIAIKTSDLVTDGVAKAIRSGEPVIVLDKGEEVARITASRPTQKPFQFDSLKEVVTGDVPDFLEPMTDAELADWERSA